MKEYDRVRITITVDIDGKRYGYNYDLTDTAWDRVAPPRDPPIHPMDVYEAQVKLEERKRLTDMVSGKIAYALVRAISEQYNKDGKE